LAVPPGITGLWQVSGRNELSYAQRVALDREYVQTASLWLDLKILLRTAVVVVTGHGAG
jgi:lipopolysaccharide/colanic/teichoic acid biosynthesis glycosyltransferase